MSAIDWVSSGEAATHAIAGKLALRCAGGDCILLRGDLGAGKTAFARGFIQALAPKGTEIVSPTFTLLQTYLAESGAVLWHFDLYRLRQAEEARELGLEDALHSGITLVEWPELLQGQWPREALDVAIGMGAQPGERHFTFAGLPSAWQDRLESVMKDD